MEIIYRDYISVRPDRVCLMTRGESYVKNTDGSLVAYADVKKQNKTLSDVSGSKKNALVKRFHNFQISVNSARQLRDKCNYLHTFAVARKIRTYTGKNIYNYKCTFLTLTLPASQKTPTAQLQSEILDPFLQVLRQRLKMANYVWRLEFQGNGNAHYHILTDTYIDYFFARKQWNNQLKKHGYIDDYANKMQNISFTDYNLRYNQGGKIPADKMFRWWQKGNASGWRDPNTVDVKSVRSADNISFYIAKYFSKNEKQTLCNSLDNESNAMGLRLCFWSRSLSRCKTDTMPVSYYTAPLIKLCNNVSEIVKRVYDYCTVFYFDLVTLPMSVKSWFDEFFVKEKDLIGYVPAGLIV